MVESQPSKLLVAGSIPVSRSSFELWFSNRQLSRLRRRGSLANCRLQWNTHFCLIILPNNVEQLLKQLDRKKVRVRDFNRVLATKALERASGSDVNARQLYEALTLSDRAQIRELYLSKLEAVDVALRHKFKKLYQYY